MNKYAGIYELIRSFNFWLAQNIKIMELGNKHVAY